MWIFVLELILLCLVVYLAFAGLYQLFLAISYFITKDPESDNHEELNRFAIIVPAHNEELLISIFCENMSQIDYPQDLRQVFIIADNCSDKTEEICSAYPVKVLARHDDTKTGKGYALEWALDQINMRSYEAVLVIDADTMVKPSILLELNKILNKGGDAIQCYMEVSNRNESWFTQLIFLSRTINDLLYHYAKYKLGLSSYLMGTGMCFSTSLLQEMKWSAFTLSEDWEYYAKLIEQGRKIEFAVNAVILPQESSSLQQATSQRLRWASGRFYVVKNLGIKLFFKGLLHRDIVMIDASLALLLPNWSLQVNMILLTLLILLLLPTSLFKLVAIGVCLWLVAIQGFIVIVGIFLTKRPWAAFKAVLIAPVFLVWKLAIDVLCITKIYKGKEWIRTKRHVPKQ